MCDEGRGLQEDVCLLLLVPVKDEGTSIPGCPMAALSSHRGIQVSCEDRSCNSLDLEWVLEFCFSKVLQHSTLRVH